MAYVLFKQKALTVAYNIKSTINGNEIQYYKNSNSNGCSMTMKQCNFQKSFSCFPESVLTEQFQYITFHYAKTPNFSLHTFHKYFEQHNHHQLPSSASTLILPSGPFWFGLFLPGPTAYFQMVCYI